MSVCVLAGSMRTESASLLLGVAVAEALADRIHTEIDVVDLCGGEAVGAQPVLSESVVEAVGRCRVLVPATPTYYGTYSGLLKLSLDLLGTDALQGKVAVPVMTGGSEVHARGGELFLRPVLLEMGCVVPFPCCYAVSPFPKDPRDLAEIWLEDNAEAIRPWELYWTGRTGPVATGRRG